jgi:predicted dehydrogenase/threonine dehydrogenase-like Zn-dependent dehydrogenase
MRVGYTYRTARELQREGLRWAFVRYRALEARRGLLRGWGVALTGDGVAELSPVEVPRPGRGQVTVRLEASAVSPGTERALYLRLPNTSVSILGHVGYSGAGVVHEVGAEVADLRPGDAVAVAGAAHASVVTVDASAVFPIPPGIGFEQAALVMLGIISGQGVTRAEPAAGDRFVVIGAGPIGLLAQRLAVADGARCVAMVATSRGKESLALAGAAERFLLAHEDAAEISGLEAPVVIEATGSPEALDVALRAAGQGSRIILLGSPRGVTPRFPTEEVRARRATLIGAHVNNVMTELARSGVDVRRREAMRFLERLSSGRLAVDDLVGDAIDPREAALFYRRLGADRNLVGAHFDWSRLDPDERVSAGHLLRVPDVRARGVDADRGALPPGAGHRQPSRFFDLADPFADAHGRLRIGLLGCGDIAGASAAAANAAPNVELVACFDPASHLAEDLAARFGAEAMPSLDALLDRDDVDAVVVSVPHHLHAPLAIQVAEAGKHVIAEKPLANTLEGALAMTEAAERAGVELTVFFPHRYAPSAVLARRLIEAGALGELGGVLLKHFLDKPAAYWLGGGSGRSISTWRSSRELAGGGVLIMNLSHYLDLLRYLSGMEIESVSGLTGAADAGSEAEDTAAFTVRLANGAVGSLIGSSDVRATGTTEFRFWGPDGHIAVEPDPRFFTLRAIGDLRSGRWQTFGKLPRPDLRAVFLGRFATAIAEGRRPDVTAEDGVAAQALIEAAYAAADQEAVVRPASLIETHSRRAAVR